MSDILSIPLCNACHTGSYTKKTMGFTIHHGLFQFVKNHGTQGQLLRIVDRKLGVEYFGELKIYLDELLKMLDDRELTDHSIINLTL